jgi:formylmethanofuran dehydrogenase subunit C
MLYLRCTDPGPIPIDASCASPDRLAVLSRNEIENLPVLHGNRPARLADIFDITGDSTDGEIRIEGDCRHVSHLGNGMTGGRLVVEGMAGDHLGARMARGMIEVHGEAGDWCGAEMRGGRIHIHGSVGDKAGAAYAGSRRGVRGGVLMVDGNAGHDLGAVLRRGTIAVGGNCGEFAGTAMIAGTILVFGSVGRQPAAGLKRGTVMTFGPAPPLLPTFCFDCSYRPPIVDLYLRQLSQWRFFVPKSALIGNVSRFRGDFVALGKGDVLVWGPS